MVQRAASVLQGPVSMGQGRVHSPVGKDQALEQGVGGQTVGAMQPCAGHLADGKQPCERGLALQARLQAAEGVSAGAASAMQGLYGHASSCR